MDEREEACSGAEGTKSLRKNMRRKVNDSDFKYPCEWIGCNYVLANMSEFNNHVSQHRREYTKCLGSDEKIGSDEFVFYCQWQDCNAHIEGQIDDFCRHVFYHTFHQYLKFCGQHIIQVEQLDACLQDTSSRNVIPELPEKLMCRWQDCLMTYDNPYIFYSHVSHHCEDYPRGNDPKVLIKCKWEGCQAITKSCHKMREHIRSHTQAKVVACPTCGSLFASNTRFIDHLKRQSPEEDLKFECSHCNNRFGSERILRDHMRHHINHYKCPLCDMTCHSPSAVRDHVRYRHSQERSFQCPQCEFKAKTAADLRKHSCTHLQKNVIHCGKGMCDKTFSNRLELFQHYHKDHEIARGYECHICAKRFSRGQYLTTHLMEKHCYRWPSGHRRFRYKRHEDGILRLQTVRYESIEVSQQVLGQKISPHSTSAVIVGANSDTARDLFVDAENDSNDGDESTDDAGDDDIVVIENVDLGDTCACDDVEGEEADAVRDGCELHKEPNVIKNKQGSSPQEQASDSGTSGLAQSEELAAASHNECHRDMLSDQQQQGKKRKRKREETVEADLNQEVGLEKASRQI